MATIRATRTRLAPGEHLLPREELAANEYHFVNRWRLPATVEEVWAILIHAEALQRWWRAAWLDYESVGAGRRRR